MDSVSSPGKNDTKISNFGLVVFILEHVMSDNVRAQNFPFSAKLDLKKKTLRLTIIVSDNPINSLYQWAFFTPAAYAP